MFIELNAHLVTSETPHGGSEIPVAVGRGVTQEILAGANYKVRYSPSTRNILVLLYTPEHSKLGAEVIAYGYSKRLSNALAQDCVAYLWHRIV